MTSTRITVLPIAIATAAVLSLAACAGSPQAAPTQPTASDPDPTATATQPPSERTFTLPTDCTQVLPGSVQADFTAQGLELLGGPGGKYPQYYSDPTPEEAAGGISCIWGNEEVPESTVTVSVAPLSTDTRGQVVDSLLAQGLNEAVIDDGVSYAQIGDDTSAPAILNVLRDDSWISVIEAIGGEAFFDEAVELAGQTADQVYR